MTPFVFHNSLTKRKEPFVPIEAGKVSIYNCGVTVYDRCHLGHARGGVVFDVLRRFFASKGYQVTYVKNYTDIDDKIIQRAEEQGVKYQSLTTKMIELHDLDMASLGIKAPDVAPKATEHIPEIIEMIQSLLDKDFAYKKDGDVFFKVRSFEPYGKLSGKNIDDLLSGSRVQVNESKEDALDFALWKAHKPGEPSWESPFGAGRPGWHIECSAMSAKYLGETFDIHAGGSDLIFPHHENEIAQSECCSGKPFVNLWLHNGMIKIDDHKMSKSLGNFFTIEELVDRYEGELIRFFLISAQYRVAINFSDAALKDKLEGLDRLYSALFKAQEAGVEARPSAYEENAQQYKARFDAALSDDLNTPMALSVMFELAKALNTGDIERAQGYWMLKDLGEVLGLLERDPEQWFKNPRIKSREAQGLTEDQIEGLINQRTAARDSKDWGLADQIRDQLAEAGVILIDKDGVTRWQKK